MKKFTLLFICILSFNLIGYSQNFVWAKTFGGTTNDQGKAICIDNSGDVVIAGLFTGTVDFDPGPGTYTLTSAGYDDVYITKLTSSGSFVWAVRFGNATGTGTGSGEKLGNITTDASGNIYAIGSFSSSVDFNPWAATNSLTSLGLNDIYILKLNTSGVYVWAKAISGTSAEFGTNIDVDATGVYTTGYFNAGADFNPSVTTTTLTNAGGADIFVCKWDLNGNYLWAKSMGGIGADVGYAVKVNPVNNNVYTTGYFYGTADISPGTTGPPSFVSTGGNDIFISALTSSAGTYTAQAQMGGTGNDNALDIVFDAIGNIYTTGDFTVSCDFDPGAAPVFLNSLGGSDAFVSKLSPSLTYLWARQIEGAGIDGGQSLAIDALGYVYASGYFTSTADFDPSASTYSLTAASQDAFVWKLNSAGNFIWAKNWGGPASETGNSIALDLNTNVYTTGYFASTCDFDPSANTYSITTTGSLDTYVSKLSCTLPQTVTTDAPLTLSLCIGTSTSMPIVMTSAPEANVAYSWSAVGASGVNLSLTTGTTTTASFTASASFSIVVTATNICGTTTTSVSDITVNLLPVVSASASPTSVCTGSLLTLSGAGASTYSWSNGVNNGVAFTPTASLTYTVMGTDINACSNTATINVAVISNPTVSITGNSVACLNSPNTLTAIGGTGFSYTWMPGSITNNTINAQPFTNSVYTVSVTDPNGCNNSAIFSVSILTPPTPDICEVTVDSLSNYNEIYWQKTLYPQADSFIVYRETTIGNFTRIGGRSAADSSMFIDTLRHFPSGINNGNPNASSWKYKLQLLDSCGNYSAYSPYHSTIFVQDQQNGNFNWSLYAIEGTTVTPVTNYNLVRRDIATGSESVAVTTSGFSATDPQYGSLWSTGIEWYVYGDGFSCDPTLRTANPNGTLVVKVKTKSNGANDKIGAVNLDKLNSVIGNNIRVYPNPAKEKVTVELGINGNMSIELMDVLGQTLFSVNTTESINTINTSSYLGGVYFFNIKLNNKIIAVKKVVLQ